MKQVLMGDLLLTIWSKPKASMAAYGGAVGEATAAKPCTTPTAALWSVGSCKKMAEENTNKGEKN